jgi:hypothetical protein
VVAAISSVESTPEAARVNEELSFMRTITAAVTKSEPVMAETTTEVLGIVL